MPLFPAKGLVPYYDALRAWLYHEHNADASHNLTAMNLGNVSNTSDAAKPVSTAQQTALDGTVKTTGDQSISGAKTFTGVTPQPVFSANKQPALSAWTLTGSAAYVAPNITIGPAAGSMAFNLAVVSGKAYQIDITTSASSGGDFTMAVGSVSATFAASAPKSHALVANTTGTVSVQISGTTWSATITGVVVREVTLATAAIMANGVELRAWGSNAALGQGVQGRLTTGGGNVAVGQYAQQNLTTGGGNIAMGHAAQQNLTIGSTNVAMGRYAQQNLTTGSTNVAVGYGVQYALTTGGGNVAMGQSAQQNLSTGNSNVAVGQSAQYAPRGLTASGTTTAQRQTTIGTESGQSSATQVDDITTIGYRATAGAIDATAIGSEARADHARSVALGSNTVTTAADQVMVGNRDIEITDITKGIIMRSPNGTRYRVTVADGGALTTTAVV